MISITCIDSDYTLSPGAISAFTDITKGQIRDWRHLGIMVDYGTQGANGRWSYSVMDLLGVYISTRLSNRGRQMDHGRALRLGRALALSVASAVVDFFWGREPFGPDDKRFVAYLFTGDSGDGELFGDAVKKLSSLSELDDCDFDRVEVIDIWRLAKRTPAEIRGQVIAAWEVWRDENAPEEEDARGR